MTEIDLNPDNAHTPERTAHTADVWAQCLRVLAYAAEPRRGGLVYPGDVYRLAGEMRYGGYLLTEVLERTGTWLQAEHEAGHFMLDQMGPDGDVGENVQAALGELRSAISAATDLYQAAARVQNALSRVASVE